MNDIVTSAELMGKVVVVTNIGKIPKNCYACQYFKSDRSYAIVEYACALNNFLVENPMYERPDFCPLRLVGR